MAVRFDAEIDAPMDRVWSFIGDFSGLERWNPSIAPIEMSGEGIGSVRTVRSPAGMVEERLEIHDPESFTLRYSVVDCNLPGPDIVGMIATIVLLPAGDGVALVWQLDRTPPLPAEAENILAGYLPARVKQLRQALARE